jgi:hypothetical protein
MFNSPMRAAGSTYWGSASLLRVKNDNDDRARAYWNAQRQLCTIVMTVFCTCSGSFAKASARASNSGATIEVAPSSAPEFAPPVDADAVFPDDSGVGCGPSPTAAGVESRGLRVEGQKLRAHLRHGESL